MRLILKYAEQTKTGSWQYRRRVPKAVSSVITKREFKQKLGESEKEALAAYPRYHAQVEREIAAAEKRVTLAQAVAEGRATDREAYQEAQRRVADMVSSGASEDDRDLMAESLAFAYPTDPETDAPLNPSKVDEYTINLLRLGAKRYAPPEATLEDAKAFYFKERSADETPEARQRFKGTVNRIVGLVKEALGSDPVLTSMTREDARTVRDYMLGRVKGTGEKISPASVARDLNGLKAVINFAAVEMPLPATFQNPFKNLSAGNKRGQSAESEKRDPLPEAVLKGMRRRLEDHAKADLALIWRLLEGTGCRLAEVTGLRVEDVDLTGDLPHLRVTWHEGRRLKTDSSRRDVPLVGDAFEAAKTAFNMHREGDLLFPAYGRTRGSDAASAALMKHLRTVTTDKKLTIHSLRHNMKDRLVLAKVSPQTQDLILGHARSGVGDRVYGGSRAKLEVSTEAMELIFKV